jgi:acyl carrier protein
MSEDLEFDIKTLIVSALNLEDLRPEDIDSEEALFGNGLGLDSIDGLELGMALRKAYGLKIESATEELREHFASVRSIARFVANHRNPDGRGPSRGNGA